MDESSERLGSQDTRASTRDVPRSSSRWQLVADIAALFAEPGQDLKPALQTIARRICELIGDRCIIRVVTEDGRPLEVGATHHQTPGGMRLLRDESDVARGADRFGLSSSISVPLQARGKLVGTIGVTRDRPLAPYTADDEQFLRSIAEHMAIGIDYALLSEATTMQSRQIQAILDAARQIVGVAELEVVLSTILDRVVELSAADTASIWLVDDTGSGVRLEAIRGLELASSRPGLSLGQGLAWEAVQRGTVINATDTSDADPRHGWLADEGGARSATAVPIRGRHECIGALVAWSRQAMPFGSAQERLIAGLAELVGVALAQSRGQRERDALEQQFLQAQKMEAIGRLAGAIAHDFNNLLTTINGFGVLALLRLDPNHAAREYIDQVVQAGERATSLTRQLLAVSRRQSAQPRFLNLSAVVTDLEKMLQRLIREDVELATRLAADLGQVHVDPGQIEQVVMNLVVNARDAMPLGGRLTIETANVDLSEGYTRTHLAVQPGAYVMLAVTDTGVGMDAETSKHMFEPFFTTKAPGKGTGLGLSTVYGIVKQSGGDIWAYSEVGRGTTFKVYLPRVKSDTTLSIAPELPIKFPRGSETVLVVEDEEHLRSLACIVLKASGYSVLDAPNGEIALQVAARHAGAIDLLVTDVVMPGLTARQVADSLRSRHPEVRILFMSGYSDDAVVRGGLADGEVAFLEKPFTPSSLTRKVRDVLDAVG